MFQQLIYIFKAGGVQVLRYIVVIRTFLSAAAAAAATTASAAITIAVSQSVRQTI